ncbi:AfsR/SARP family transcriptional regulator [Streptosporangium sp. NPDC051022]|uniref:AfsR/SARP family transcriptional regulator n=1 Tax=Streptosporangium sp. NPDC051022 TaxID=3155752 RepID=UPI003426D26C
MRTESFAQTSPYASGIKFHILGPFEVSLNGRQVSVPAGKRRTLLVSLLLEANNVIPTEELIVRLWDDDLPREPRGALHTCVNRLRQTLASLSREAAAEVRTTASGYAIDIDQESLDLIRLRRLVAKAHSAGKAGDLAAEVAGLAEALSLWRGPVLSDVQADPIIRETVPKLTDELLWALERHNDLCLGLGWIDGHLITSLRSLTTKHPFRERLWWQLMLALFHSGRQVEALKAYATVSHSLREEMGIDPSQQLQRLHMEILQGDAKYPLQALAAESPSRLAPISYF